MGCSNSPRKMRPDFIPPQKIGLECPICLSELTTITASPVNCGHILHLPCLINHFNSSLQIKKFPILCLVDGCNQQLSHSDIKQYFPYKQNKKFHELTLSSYVEKHMDTTSWCPTAGCPAVFCIDEGEQVKMYNCPSCRYFYCLECRSEAHPSLTCQANRKLMQVSEQQFKQFQKAVKAYKMKQCPRCKFWIEKNQGCDHMKCRCKYEFCFNCGAKYGQCPCARSD